MTSGSKIIKGLKNPRKALEYIILGGKSYDELYQKNQELIAELKKHTCKTITNPSTPLESRMVMDTDIHEHLCTLYMLTLELNLKNVLELGTRSGDSTIALLQASKEIGGSVTSIDIDSCLQAKKLVDDLHLNYNWNFIQCDDLKVDWNKPIDHLFIDTSHTYDHTLAELKKYEPYVKEGGIITFHDTVSRPPILEAIKKYIEGRKELRFYHYFNNNGLGILKKQIN